MNEKLWVLLPKGTPAALPQEWTVSDKSFETPLIPERVTKPCYLNHELSRHEKQGHLHLRGSE